jgi:hypothetical protein
VELRFAISPPLSDSGLLIQLYSTFKPYGCFSEGSYTHKNRFNFSKNSSVHVLRVFQFRVPRIENWKLGKMLEVLFEIKCERVVQVLMRLDCEWNSFSTGEYTGSQSQ